MADNTLQELMDYLDMFRALPENERPNLGTIEDEICTHQQTRTLKNGRLFCERCHKLISAAV